MIGWEKDTAAMRNAEKQYSRANSLEYGSLQRLSEVPAAPSETHLEQA
jgi:hypothetical protein